MALALIAPTLAGFGMVVTRRARRHEARAEAQFPPTGQILDIDGHRVHAVVMGDGPDLVLLHGSGGNLNDFTFELAPVLARDYRLILLDRPGHGYTDRINATGATLSQQADLLRKAAQALGADKPIVAGHSYGGSVALAWAVNHPDDIAAVVPLAAPSHPWTTGLPAFYRLTSNTLIGPLVIPLLTAFVSDTTAERKIAAVFAPDTMPDGYHDHFGAALTLRRASLRANGLQRANLLADITALAPHYGKISVPTEILHGDADATVGFAIHAEPLVRDIPGAMLTPLPGTGHMPQHAAPDAVIAAIHRAATRARLR